MERYRNRIFHLSAPFNNSPLFNKNLEENIGSKKKFDEKWTVMARTANKRRDNFFFRMSIDCEIT